MWNLKRNDTNELILTNQEKTHRYNELIVAGGKDGGKGQRVRNGKVYLKWITNKGLLYSTWSSSQCYVADCTGEEFGEEWIHVYV